MKNKTRLTLLLMLAVALLLGVLAAVPFVASADGEVTLTVYIVDESGNQIANYGEITPAGVVENASTVSYSAVPGTTITLTMVPNGNYTFVAWTDDPIYGDNLGNGDLSVTLASNTTRYAVFEPTEYRIYYVGAKNETTPPDAVKVHYGTDLEFHPEYLKTMSLKSTRKYGEEVTVSPVTAKTDGGDLTHTFDGWKAYTATGVEIELENNDTIKAETNCDVYLVPQWTPIRVDVTRIDLIGTPEDVQETALGSNTAQFNYGATVSGEDFDNQDYDGYDFTGSSSIVVDLDTTTNIVYCYYTPHLFEITFYVNAPDDKEITTPEKLTVFYRGTTPSITPLQCKGYRFCGYVDAVGDLCFNADGTPTDKIATWTALSNITLYAQWEKLSPANTPAWTIDYANEALKDIVPGDYQITCGEDVQTVTVSEGETLSIVSFLGKTIQVVRLGVDGETADSVPQTIAFSDRPSAVEFKCTLKTETKRTRELLVEVPGGTEGLYEVAYTTPDQDIPENWTTDLLLKDLKPGVTYTIYLRVRATDAAPHGVTAEPQTFEFSHLVDLKPLFIILVCLLALQLLALAFLLIGRRRAGLNAVAAPLAALLAVKLIPAGLFPWIIILTVAVVALQVVLVVLALQSSIVWKKRPGGKKNSEEKVDRLSDTAEFTLFGEKRTETDQPAQKDDKEDENN